MEQAVPPKGIPNIPSECLFQDPPKFCAVTAEASGRYTFVVDTPLIMRGGVHRVLVTVTCRPDSFSFKKAFRSALHRRVPLSNEQLVKYREWYDQVVPSHFSSAVATLSMEEEDPDGAD